MRIKMYILNVCARDESDRVMCAMMRTLATITLAVAAMKENAPFPSFTDIHVNCR